MATGSPTRRTAPERREEVTEAAIARLQRLLRPHPHGCSTTSATAPAW